MIKYVTYIDSNKHDKLIRDGFHTQELFADDQLYFIRDIEGGVIDQSLFLRGDDGYLKDFIQLDFSSLTMYQDFAEKDGVYRAGLEWVADINVDQLRDNASPLAALVESIQSGLFDGDISPSTRADDSAGKEMVFLGYNVLTGKMSPLTAWRPENKVYSAPNQEFLESVKFYSQIPKWIIRIWVPKYHFDWIFNNAKTGFLRVVNKSQ